jgi:outer membrane protein assembly factor BamB
MMFTQGAPGQDWPKFRGPNGGGVSSAENVPAEFGPEKNLAWKREIPFGHSSPIIAGDIVFLTGADAAHLITLCLERKSGKTRWQGKLPRARNDKIFDQNSSATPTPVTDGENVYAFFPEYGLVSYDQAGTKRWSHKLGSFRMFYGMGGSPILSGDSLILVCDQERDSFIVSFDKITGTVQTRIRTYTDHRSGCFLCRLLRCGNRQETLGIGQRRIPARDQSYYSKSYGLRGYSQPRRTAYAVLSSHDR